MANAMKSREAGMQTETQEKWSLNPCEELYQDGDMSVEVSRVFAFMDFIQ